MAASPLRLAIRTHDISRVRELLVLRPKAVADIEGGLSHLYVAACWNCTEIGELLIDAHCDIDRPSSENITPLLIAIKCGHRLFAKMLISRGAKVNATSLSGESPLSCALELQDDELSAVLIANGASVVPTSAVVTKRDRNYGMQLFLQPGSSVTVFSPHRECVCWIDI